MEHLTDLTVWCGHSIVQISVQHRIQHISIDALDFVQADRHRSELGHSQTFVRVVRSRYWLYLGDSMQL